jgi:ParB-like chromosome segregation protein Spo0J
MPRVSGFKFSISGFLPVDKTDVDKQIGALNLVKAAQTGDLAFIKKLKAVSVSAKATSMDDKEIAKAEEKAAKAAAKAAGKGNQPKTAEPADSDQGGEYTGYSGPQDSGE